MHFRVESGVAERFSPLKRLYHASCVANIVRNHNRRIKRGKIERRNRLIVEAALRLNDRRALIALACVLSIEDRQIIIHAFGLQTQHTTASIGAPRLPKLTLRNNCERIRTCWPREMSQLIGTPVTRAIST